MMLWGMMLSLSTDPARAAPKSETRAAPAAGPALIGQFDAWGVYSGMRGGRKVCFALARPTMSRTNPPNRPHDPAYIFVTTTPSGTVVNQVSVIIGYNVKPDTTSTIDIGNASYVMYAQGDGLWIKNESEETRLVEAMRRAAELLVRGTSTKGVDVVDSYSLKGLAQALERVAQECRH